MNVFSRLALGTSNWNERKPYGHRQVTCPRSEQEKILEYSRCCGIDTIHTKTEYDVDLSWISTAFNVLHSNSGHCLSVYDLGDMDKLTDDTRIVQVPYSPFNRTWEPYIGGGYAGCPEWHVRSIFVQGKVFTSEEPVFVRFRQYAGQLGIPAGTLCILFCLLNLHVDKVIVGVDSLGQLKDNLRFFHRLDSFQVDDESITDPRQWGEP